MGNFSSNLVVEITDNKKYPYRVRETFEFSSGAPGSGLLIRCPEGFTFDGTSIPRYLQWLISPSDPKLLQCAAIHDMGFSTGTMIMRGHDGVEELVPVHRGTINALMDEMMIAKKVSRWKRRVINTGLAVGSRGIWERYREVLGAIRTATTL